MLTFWKKKQPSAVPSLPFPGKIEVFSRHCTASSISQHKKRLPHFSHKRCYENLLETIDRTKANLTFFLDEAKGRHQDHYLASESVIRLNEGTEGGSFMRMIEHIANLSLDPETIIYLVEDDYLHRPHWVDVLIEGFQVKGADYVTLYDHLDKYRIYPKLSSRIFTTPSCHWRSTPSTTQTFATKVKTLLRDFPIHRKYSEGKMVSEDHAKFLHLGKRGAMLISSIPGWSTHVDFAFASPCIDWESLLIQNLSMT